MSGKIVVLALFLVLLLSFAASAQHPEVILKNEMAEKMADLTLSSGMCLKPVFSIPEGKMDDMIRMGIVRIDRDGGGRINLYEALIEIEKDPISYLEELRARDYNHASMVTADEGGPIYEFRGHRYTVTIPEYCDLAYETSFNLYNTHLSFPDGHFIESGVGWIGRAANWPTEGLNLYVYNSYSGEFSFRSISDSFTPIPDGYGREITLSVRIDCFTGRGVMYGYDPVSRTHILREDYIYADRGCVDQCQEQHSYSFVWTPTGEAYHFNNRLWGEYDDQPIDWICDGVPTDFWPEPPMHLQIDEYDGKSAMVTWCEP